MPTFTVDTHLFRELGELLVGRDSTALIELVKNAYDADATQVIVYGEDLEKPAGLIRIVDNGSGMSVEEFRQGFLRVAARGKTTGDRRSPLFGRRYTGAKGVGRLAAHKLARVLEVISRPRAEGASGVEAAIDWNRVEAAETLDQLEMTNAISVAELASGTGIDAGTVITLRELRRAWSRRERARFLEEVQTFQPPDVLVRAIPKTTLPSTLLFAAPAVRDARNPKQKDPGLKVLLEGDLAPPDDFWLAAVEASDWVLEIDARPEGVRYGISPTVRGSRSVPPEDADQKFFEIRHPAPKAGPFFQARILVRAGGAGNQQQRQWTTRNAGVRVYMEGFRVLPYGEAGDDWLRLDRDYVRRDRGALGDLPELTRGSLPKPDDDDGLTILPQKSYFGGVFLTHEGATSLDALVNREGFVPNASFDALREVVRTGIDLTSRVRASASREQRARRRAERLPTSKDLEPADGRLSATELEASFQSVRTLTSEARALASVGDLEGAVGRMDSVLAVVQALAPTTTDLARESAMFRVLASIGTQFAGFIHEIRGLLASAEAIERALDRLRLAEEGQTERSRALARLHRAAGDLRQQLERQAAFLIDVVSPDGRRRRSRQIIRERFESGSRLVAHIAAKRGIQIENHIDDGLKSPPMFPSELTAVFSNLLTNAVKAAGDNGKVVAGSELRGGVVRVWVANTGVRVQPEDGERWFRPFESSTTKLDPVLGQGMGLGLTISRAILEEYGITIRFAKPPEGLSTSLELVFDG